MVGDVVNEGSMRIDFREIQEVSERVQDFGVCT